MGKMYDRWKKAKRKATHLDLKALFKEDFGRALEKWEDAWTKAKGEVLAKRFAGTLTKADCDAAGESTSKLLVKAKKIAFGYEDLILKEGKKNKANFAKATDPDQKQELKAISEELRALLTVLNGISGDMTTDNVLWLKQQKSKAKE